MSSTFSKFISSAQNEVIKRLATIRIRETAQSRAKAQNVNNSKKNYTWQYVCQYPSPTQRINRRNEGINTTRAHKNPSTIKPNASHALIKTQTSAALNAAMELTSEFTAAAAEG